MRHRNFLSVVSMTRCHCCGADAVNLLTSFAALDRVSSDCKPIMPGGEIGRCMVCGTIQKPKTKALQSVTDEIYASYDVYYQGGGSDQLVLDSRDGLTKRRSDVLVDRLRDIGVLGLPGEVFAGQSLDVGCGNGAFLAAIARKAPAWRLNGLDLDDRHAAALERIPSFDRLITSDIQNLTGRYDLISAIHALEHFPDPAAALVTLRKCLAPEGKLFIETPNVAENPFDIVIADHVSHFTPATLTALLGRTGYHVLSVETDWIGKEISVVARVADEAPVLPPTDVFDIDASIAWLRNIQEEALALSNSHPIGLFGTSIAATWLAGSIGTQRIAFFVDEDPARQGRTHFGKPILTPTDVPMQSVVYFCLAPAMAGKIAAKMSRLGFVCATPGQARK
jgi:2-polyprenyl-3-methyl-5-hydroxy-6-metoxy-1,4-benzoquinol methylase